MALDLSKKLDIKKLLKGLEKYRPRRRGWTWRPAGGAQLGPFGYSQCSEPPKTGQALASAQPTLIEVPLALLGPTDVT